MFKDLPRIEQPRPDITYGLWKKDLSSLLCNILDKYHCDLAKGLYLPFFIVEVKTQDAIPGEAENQCIRGGASLVNTIHQWNRVAAGKTHFNDMTPKDKTDQRKEFADAAEKAKQVCTLVFPNHRVSPIAVYLLTFMIGSWYYTKYHGFLLACLLSGPLSPVRNDACALAGAVGERGGGLACTHGGYILFAVGPRAL